MYVVNPVLFVEYMSNVFCQVLSAELKHSAENEILWSLLKQFIEKKKTEVNETLFV